MSGVLILSFSTVIVKIIGLAYKIPLMSLLGAEGMGYFNTAYEIFALLCGISTSGLPVAISMLVSMAREKGDAAALGGIFKTSSALMLTKGVVISALLAVFAPYAARIVGNPDAALAILAISPSVFFSCAAGAIRGYFQGCRQMLPTAVSQLTEALSKLGFGAGFAAVAVARGADVPTAAAFAVLGVSVGSLLSAAYLFVRKRREGIPHSEKRRGFFMPLLRISFPITLCSALVGTTRMIDMTLLMRRLTDVGLSPAEANRIYGSYTTLALPVFGLVPAFIPPITESLIPRLAAAVSAKDGDESRRAVANAMRLTAIVSLPASLGISVYSRQIIGILFSNESEAVKIAAPMLSVLGASVVLSCLITTSGAVLHSYGRVVFPIAALGVGAFVKAVSAYFLIGDPQLAEMGAPISTLFSNAAVLCLELIVVRRVCGKTGLGSCLPRAALASIVSIALSYALYAPLSGRLGETPAFLLALALAVVAYFAASVILGVIGKNDLGFLPTFLLKRKRQ